uniref:Uncharacterized protein n=1 Tax=Lygus hesperus TaxID=30085 RepID=A0A146L7T3_LYGHE
MKFAQVSLIVGVLLLQILLVKTQEDPANISNHNEETPAGHMANDEPVAATTPPPEPTRVTKTGDTEPSPPLIRNPATEQEKKADGPTPVPTSAENNTTQAPGGSNSVYHSMALVFCVTSFLYFI